jgi:Fe-S cluster assembly protein SufD
LSSLYLSQQAQSHYQGTTLAFGSAWARTEYHTRFEQEGAACELNGLYTVGDGQLTDFHLDVQHSVPGCVSREQFKGVLYGKGRAVFDGRILVDKQAQHSDAQLTNDNLMLTRNAEVDTKPQLEIYADDVKCSHGTTIGQLDPQQVFYLRSRGIDETAARKILCLGFAGEVLDSIEVPALRDAVTRKLSDTLNAAVEVEG